jgi:hypothetical protein
MKFIPKNYVPLAVAALLGCLAWGAYFALDVFDIGPQAVSDCCMAE